MWIVNLAANRTVTFNRCRCCLLSVMMLVNASASSALLKMGGPYALRQLCHLFNVLFSLFGQMPRWCLRWWGGGVASVCCKLSKEDRLAPRRCVYIVVSEMFRDWKCGGDGGGGFRVSRCIILEKYN